jgi:cytochrome c-type biogenesis protein CcmH/NrfG
MSEDINQQILAEIRKLKRIFYAMLVVMVLTCIPFFYYAFTQDSSVSWTRVTTAMRHQNFPAALSMAQSLVRQQPDYYYGHAYLGAIYLAMDDVTNAEREYSRAYQLFPSEEDQKELAAVQKRMTSGAGEFKLMSK